MADPTPDRRRIARFLTDHGPTPGDTLAAALGMSADRFWTLISCPWFDIGGRGWQVSARAKREGADGVRRTEGGPD